MSCERADLKLRLRLSLAILCLLLVANASANDKAAEQARPLLKAAAERSLFLPDSSSPFSLQASFTVYRLAAKRLDGKFEWWVNSDGDWVKQLSFADYRDLQIGKGSNVWTKRSVQFQPLQAALVQNAFHVPQYLDLSEDTVDRYFTMSDQHVKLRCAELLHGRDLRTVCIDPEQNLSTIQFRGSRVVYEYSDYRPAGNKFIPHRIVAKREGNTLLEATINEVTAGREVDLHVPEPPEGAIKRGGCLTPSLPTLKHREVPDFPTNALRSNRQGQVMMYVLLGSDGKVQNAVVTQTAGEAMDASALGSVRHWQYEPARCDGTPIEFETEVSVNFWIEIRVQ